MLLRILADISNRRRLGPVASRWKGEKTCVCPVCQATARILDSVDFNKSCEGSKVHLPRSKMRVDYYYCQSCGFCHAPALYRWGIDEFKSRIYNADYALVDPEFVETRPLGNADQLEKAFGHHKHALSHLDYGGGDGRLSRRLREFGWRSSSYDPIIDGVVDVEGLGRHDLVTAFEVFEHVPDMDALVSTLARVTKTKGLVLFTTLLSDGHIDPSGKLDWWYAAPRNGHVSLYSSESLSILMRKHGFRFRSLSTTTHLAYFEWPDWAPRFA